MTLRTQDQRHFVRGALGGRRVLVTGHTGFKGSWLCMWLRRLGAEVHGYALDPPTEPSHFQTSAVAEILASDTRADVSSRRLLADWVGDNRPDLLLHLAAAPIVRAARADPRATFETNVLGTVHLLDAVRDARRPCSVVVVTSDKCYRTGPDVPSDGYGEDAPLGGAEPYAASKAAAELVIEGYRGAYFPPASAQDHGVLLASARAGNAVGGGDFAPGRLLPDIARALAAAEPVNVRFPSAIRPWQHVLDPLWGYLLLGAHLLGHRGQSFCGAWNFGPQADDQVRVDAVVDRAIQEWGSGTWVVVGDGRAVGETAELRLSSQKARCQLSWSPRWSLVEAVGRTIRWYATYASDPTQGTCAASTADLVEHEEGPVTDAPAGEGVHA